jgi:hypothetical protein
MKRDSYSKIYTYIRYSNLSARDKEICIKEIKRMVKLGIGGVVNDREWNSIPVYLSGAFSWTASSLGWDFWHNIDNKINKGNKIVKKSKERIIKSC